MDKYGFALSVAQKDSWYRNQSPYNTATTAGGCYMVLQYKPCYQYTTATAPSTVAIKELDRDVDSK